MFGIFKKDKSKDLGNQQIGHDDAQVEYSKNERPHTQGQDAQAVNQNLESAVLPSADTSTIEEGSRAIDWNLAAQKVPDQPLPESVGIVSTISDAVAQPINAQNFSPSATASPEAIASPSTSPASSAIPTPITTTTTSSTPTSTSTTPISAPILPETTASHLASPVTNSDSAPNSPIKQDATQVGSTTKPLAEFAQMANLNASAEDVIAAYKIFLGRLPESAQVVQARMGPPIGTLLVDFLLSAEFLQNPEKAQLILALAKKIENEQVQSGDVSAPSNSAATQSSPDAAG